MVAFWGAMLGGIVPVPVAVGISDEHRQKLFRIARQLGDPVVYTDDDVLHRLKAFAAAQKNDAAAKLLEEQIITDDSNTRRAEQGRLFRPGLHRAILPSSSFLRGRPVIPRVSV
ncbi:MAG: hypothetical protein U5K38_09460 [Woeseiaceae bacterium]|nr:hypothetical protein [Woeseiaceae bacterium]